MVKFTHLGWFGLVPVKIANKDSATPYLEPRFGLPTFLVELQAWAFTLCGMILPGDWQFPIKITKKLED